MIGWEANQFDRLIKYLRNVEKSYEDTDQLDKKRKDFTNFITQYSERRSKPLDKYLPKNMLKWIQSI